MNGDDITRIVGLSMSLVLIVANLRGKQLGLSDGLRMAALWGFLITAIALVFSIVAM